MSLNLVRTESEGIVAPEVEGRLRAALAAGGRAVLLVPSFAQALAAQRALAEAGGLSLGVTVTTLPAWAEERWEVWGDGRRLADDVSRGVLAHRVLSRAAGRPGAPVTDTPGTAALVADLARRGLPWLVGVPVPEGVTGAEAAVVALLADYEAELSARGLVEGCSAMAALPELLDASGALVPPLVLAGFSQMTRAERELVCGLAARHEVTLVARAGEAPAQACARALVGELADLARRRGAEVVEGAPVSRPAAAPAGRARELEVLLGTLFTADPEPVSPEGAVRLLLPAGPSAEPELVVREVRRLAEGGARDVVVVSPDPARAWSELSARLAARGASVRAQLSVPVPSLECGRAYLEFVRMVARLVELDATWPASEALPDAPRAGMVRVRLADMSWWPPRELSDFLVSDVSHLDADRARALDASWRGNRLLVPSVVLEQLQSERDVSPEVAAATRELLRGRLGSAASKLLAPYVQGEKVGSPAAPEAAAVLSAVLGVAKSLKELGVTADPSAPGRVSLSELAALAEDVLSRTRATLRLELPGDPGSCLVRIVPESAAARMEPLSADALLLLGQTSAESAVSTPDDVGSALLAAYGVEPEPRAMDAARARFLQLASVPRAELALERTLFGADGKECYPSVMAIEVMARYGVVAGAKVGEVRAALGAERVPSRSETLVGENASAEGRAPRLVGSEVPAPAGRIDPSERECVSPPPEGRAADERPLLSASQIETYLECPYKWFSLRRLRLRDADAGFTGAEMGTFAHRVLEVSRRELLARAQERALGAHALADARAEHADAMQRPDYREEVARLEALAQRSPELRLGGSSVADPGALEEARAILLEEFDAHLSHQFQLDRRRRPVQPQALVPHSAQQEGQLRGLRRDLSTLLDYEAGMLRGFEPRLFEWDFGRGGAETEYAGVRLTGTIDRVDVDAHGQAVVIDYKHKSSGGFAGEYDVFPEGGADPSSLALPRRVQSLVYGQVVRRAFPGIRVRAAVYLCTKGDHALAGAVDENLMDGVFGERCPSAKRAARVAVPCGASFGREGSSGMEALLDACEELVAARLERMLAGDIEAAPVDADACLFCPVLNCERRLRK